MTAPKFSVVVVARNEEKTLPRLLRSLEEFFNRGGEMILVNTGSSDQTAKVARDGGCKVVDVGDRFRYVIDEQTAQSINNKFVVHPDPEIIHGGDSFFAFDQARNFAMEQSSNEFIVTPDADEAFTTLNIDKINELIEHGYEKFLIEFVFAHHPDGSPAVQFMADTRFYDRRKIKWKGIIHETMRGEAKMIRLTKNVVLLEHYQNQETDRKKYLAGLAWACAIEPDNDRNSHYFARELMYRGYYRSSIKEFQRHIDMDKWPDERGQSMVYTGTCYDALGESDKALGWWHKAFDLTCSRREPLLCLANYWKRKDKPAATAAYAAAALQIPNNGFYANRVANYTFEPHSLLYWAKGWMGDIPSARQHLTKCLEFHPTEASFLRDMQYYFNEEEITEAKKKAGLLPTEKYPSVPDSINLNKLISPKGLKVLNVGVGPGESWLAQQLPFMEFKQLDHLDINKEWLDKAAGRKWAAETVNFIHQDVREFDRFGDYDLILFFDVIEHFVKGEALKLLAIPVKKMVFSPIEDELGENWGKDHLSLWTEQEFKDLGFKTTLLPKFHRMKGGKLVDAVWAWDIPLVSVLMPAYNVDKFIDKAIRSVQAQTLRDWELIVVDDGSKDRTAEIAKRYASEDGRIKFYQLPENHGYPKAFNECVKHASGKYIARMDADDWDDPTRLEKCVVRLASGFPICDCVSTSTFYGEEGGERLISTEREGMVPEKYMDFDCYGHGGAPVNATIVTKREVYDTIGGFRADDNWGMDSDWDVRANLAGFRWAYIDEPLYHYRKHGNQTVNQRGFHWYRDQQKMFLTNAKPFWTNQFNPHRHIEVMVTGKCNRKCQYCSQADYNEKYKDYQTPMELIHKLCDRSKAIGANYEWIQFSGGEPFLWDNLEEACRLVKDRGAFKKIRVFSNCYNWDRMARALDDGLIDMVYTNSTNASPSGHKLLGERFPGKSTIAPLTHKQLPVNPLDDVLPARCNCNHPCVIENNVYPCGNFFEHVTRLGKNINDYKFCTLDDDWIGFYRNVDRFNMDICAYCLANGRVWEKV